MGAGAQAAERVGEDRRIDCGGQSGDLAGWQAGRVGSRDDDRTAGAADVRGGFGYGSCSRCDAGDSGRVVARQFQFEGGKVVGPAQQRLLEWEVEVDWSG